MMFVYQEKKITVQNPSIIASSGVLVYDSKDEEQAPIDKLKFNDMALGLKPITGDADADTGIPSTMTDKIGTEGLYATVKVTAPAGLKIVITNIQINSEQDKEKVQEERKNIFMAIKDKQNSAQSLEEESITLVDEELEVKEKEYTIFFWLDGKAGEALTGAKISFELHFIA